MVIDTVRGVGCMDCVVACKTENQVPEGFNRDWIAYDVTGTFPTLHMEIRSERCNHCDNPPCVSCCPTAAPHVRPPTATRTSAPSASTAWRIEELVVADLRGGRLMLDDRAGVLHLATSASCSR